VQFFGGERGEAVGKIKAHLVAKHRARACACAVAFLHTFGYDAMK